MSHLNLTYTWKSNGHSYARWSPESITTLSHIKDRLNELLQKTLSGRCGHIKGNGGLKGSIRAAQAMIRQYRYVARFDIFSYYESIDHEVLLSQLTDLIDNELNAELHAQIQAYLVLPDKTKKGKGIVASGAISPLLGAVYLTPLDRTMQALAQRQPIKYQRFMDDYLIFAKSRHALRKAIKSMYDVLATLKLQVHPDKRFIGLSRKGVDFLGYRLHPARKLHPAAQSFTRLYERARRLHEQGVDEHRLRQYVQRWYSWLHGGLRGMVSTHGRLPRVWQYIQRRLNF
jgi:RNA-directed DNA polymerase